MQIERTVEDFLADIAERVGVLSYQKLMRKRSKHGYQCFIQDLKSQPEVKGTGWTLKDGLLTVQLNHDESELEQFLTQKLSHYPWFETPEDLKKRERNGEVILPPSLPSGYEKYQFDVKALGKYGKNQAMDAIFIVKLEDGSLAVQTITRFDKTIAFMGGMIEAGDSVIGTCCAEIFEELFSADIFAKGSKTLREAAKFSAQEHEAAIANSLKNAKFAPLEQFKQELINIMKQNSPFEGKIKAIEAKLTHEYVGKQVTVNGKTYKLPKDDLNHLSVLLKCELYRCLFPEQYKDFESTIKDSLIHLDETINEADPRNTNTAYMTTIPHYAVMDNNKLNSKFQNWLVKPIGGDDAISAKLRKLEDLYQSDMYSSHLKILTKALLNIHSTDPEFFNDPAIKAQLEKLEGYVINREADELDITNKGLTVFVKGTKVTTLPPANISSEAQLTQFSNLQAATQGLQPGEITIEITNDVERANRDLLERLGRDRYNFLCQQLEVLNLPLSFRAEISKMHGQNFAIVLDDSGSMNSQFDGNSSNAHSRWQEARNRFVELIPIFALAGIDVSIYRLNQVNNNLKFKFSSAQDPRLEANRAVQKINQLFDVSPIGTTEGKAVFDKVLKDYPGSSRILFLTDGELDDPNTVGNILKNKFKQNVDTSLIVVACTNNLNIDWAKRLRDDFKVAILPNLEEAKEMIGAGIKYTPAIHNALHVIEVKNNNPEGLAIYFKLLSGHHITLLRPELSGILGYEVSELEYAAYVSAKEMAYTEAQQNFGQRFLPNNQYRSTIPVAQASHIAIGNDNNNNAQTNVQNQVQQGMQQQSGWFSSFWYRN